MSSQYKLTSCKLHPTRRHTGYIKHGALKTPQTMLFRVSSPQSSALMEMESSRVTFMMKNRDIFRTCVCVWGGGHSSVSDSKLSPTPDVSKTTWLLKSVESKNDNGYLKGSQPVAPLNTSLISSRMINHKRVGVCRADSRPPAELN